MEGRGHLSERAVCVNGPKDTLTTTSSHIPNCELITPPPGPKSLLQHDYDRLSVGELAETGSHSSFKGNIAGEIRIQVKFGCL
ncbi:uncharacterized protein EI90DRAFT_3089365, partial [Cantharellus anzutake]|uniref:uncharacterized protein n=1 Tax=Cantharellus anzutake TaxID=1750568 RepID=UPI001908ED24